MWSRSAVLSARSQERPRSKHGDCAGRGPASLAVQVPGGRSSGPPLFTEAESAAQTC